MTYNPIGATDKFRRGCEHLKAIEEIVLAWDKVTTYETITEPDPDSNGLVHCQRYVAKIGGPPFPDISTLLGDCLHNFRCVLDHMVWFASIIESGDPPPNPKGISFPVRDTSAGYKSQGLHAVSAKVSSLVEALQPYHAGKDGRSHPLWLLSELDNVDKHRQVHAVHHVALAPVISVTSSKGRAWFEAMEPGPVEDGTVVARVFNPVSFTTTEVEVNLNLKHGVAIERTQTTPSVHLGGTLVQIRDAVQNAAKLITAAL